MNKQTTEQLKSIVDNAPDGATHYDKFQNQYWDWPNRTMKPFDGIELDLDYPDYLSSLADIQAMVDLRRENAELEKDDATKNIGLKIKLVDAQTTAENMKFKIAKLEKENKLLKQVEQIFNESPDLTFGMCKRLFNDELEAYNLELHIKSINNAVETCEKHHADNLGEEVITVIDLLGYIAGLRSQAKALKESK